jgi:hypothetical protein
MFVETACYQVSHVFAGGCWWGGEFAIGPGSSATKGIEVQMKAQVRQPEGSEAAHGQEKQIV